MKLKFFKLTLLITVCILFFSCKNDVLPKPNGQLRLEYPLAQYTINETNCNYNFDFNIFSSIKSKENCNFEINYPKLKATIYLNYKPINKNLENLLRDAQKLTYEHVVKADGISEQPFINKSEKTFGMFYEVGGNAASQSQFYVTDSTKHFLSGSVYFYAKPNFDSILPAAEYIKADIRKIMESLKWRK